MFHKPIATAVIAALLMTGTLSPVSPTSGQGAQLQKATPLTEAEVITIALDHAGLTADQVSGLCIKLDTEDRTAVYEIEFRVGRTEYEYELHAETGKILDLDRGIGD